MNYLKKKLKPLTTGLTNAATNVTASGAGSSSSFGRHNHHHNKQTNRHNFDKDLEDDLYDEYVVEAPPHPSELLALGVDPTDIDVNNPEKLKELYRKAKEEGKDKKTNSVLLARQRQKEEIEEKKKTREEWKFFDSITARVEQVVKDSQKTLEQLKESSAIDKLSEPEYELKLTADEVFKSSSHLLKQEKNANNWIDFGEDDDGKSGKGSKSEKKESKKEDNSLLLDEFGCPIERRRSSAQQQASGLKTTGDKAAEGQSYVVEELLKDFGIDLRSAEARKLSEEAKKSKRQDKEETTQSGDSKSATETGPKKLDIDLKAAARPRPRPAAAAQTEQLATGQEEDPFDTSFVADPFAISVQEEKQLFGDERDLRDEVKSDNITDIAQSERVIDPFDTSHVNLQI